MACDPSIAEIVRSNQSTIPPRPILTHLNADTAWLISFPNPPSPKLSSSATSLRHNGRAYFHVLLDPWLTGTNVVLFRWIMSFTHAVAGACGSIEDVKALIREVEQVAAESVSKQPTDVDDGCGDDGEVDAVFVSHFLEDHCNRETLTQVGKNVPVVGIAQGVKTVKSWNHFDEASVLCMPDLEVDAVEKLWQSNGISWETSTDPNKLIPPWLRIGIIPSQGAYPYLHWATIIAWSPDHQPLGQDSSTRTETIFYSPHGIYADRLQNLDWTHPTSTHNNSMLAVLHGLGAAFSPQPANLGINNGWEVVKKTKPRYWIPTHDEELTYTGIIGWMQTKLPGKFEDVVKAANDRETTADDEKRENDVVMRELANGESFILA